MEILFIENTILEKLGNKLLPNNNIELKMLEQYKLERYDVNLYDVVGKIIVAHYYGDEEVYGSNKLDSFFKESTFLTIITMFIETIDIVLLNRVSNIDFENIVYERHDDEGYYFKVIPRTYEE